MIGRITDVCVAVIVLILSADQAMAQAPAFEVSGGYQGTRATDQTLPTGWSADVAGRLNASWSVVGEASGSYRTEGDEDLGVDVGLSIHALAAGLRWSRRSGTRIVPFLQLLAGAARIRARAQILDTTVGDGATDFMVQPGGGVRVRVTEMLGLVGQLDYRRVVVGAADDSDSGANQFRVLLGIRVGW